MKRIANYLLTATALLGAAALLTFAAKNDFGLARNMETLVNMMRELSVYYVCLLYTSPSPRDCS